jgi:hypothetical protein
MLEGAGEDRISLFLHLIKKELINEIIHTTNATKPLPTFVDFGSDNTKNIRS